MRSERATAGTKLGSGIGGSPWVLLRQPAEDEPREQTYVDEDMFWSEI
jgi:hypothetical protein